MTRQGNSKDKQPVETVTALRDRRCELNASQKEVAKEMGKSDENEFEVTRRTLEGYISKWERGDLEPTDEQLAAYETALDEIEAEQNREHPACSDPACSNSSPELEPLEIDGEPYCEVCYYIREIEAPPNGGYSGGSA